MLLYKYRDPKSIVFVIYSVVTMCMYLLIAILTTYIMFKDGVIFLQTVFVIIVWAIVVCAICFLAKAWTRACGTLIIYNDKIVRKCLFCKDIILDCSKNIYIGIADASENNCATPIIRGDEISFIYLSENPLPFDLEHKINTAIPKSRIIWVHYTDKLCEIIVETFQNQNTCQLSAFYKKMKEADIRLAKEKEKYKRKKLSEKKKEKKRKEKQE